MQVKERHLCKIPCECMPLVSAAAYIQAGYFDIHVDRTAEFHVLIYLLKGSMEILEDGVVYTLEERNLFFLKANVHHWGVKSYEPGTSWYYVHFYAPEPSNEMTPLSLQLQKTENHYWGIKDFKYYIPLPKQIAFPPNSEIANKIDELIRRYQSCKFSELIEINLLLWGIFIKSYEINFHIEEEQTGRKRVRKIIQFLENHLNKPFTAAEIENALGLSYKYIGTILKTETGMTIKNYHQMLRIKEAESLLCFTGLSISEIADLLGYADVFYFSNVFKKVKGISPTHFRAMYIPLI